MGDFCPIFELTCAATLGDLASDLLNNGMMRATGLTIGVTAL